MPLTTLALCVCRLPDCDGACSRPVPVRHAPIPKPGTALHPIRRPGKTRRDKERRKEAP